MYRLSIKGITYLIIISFLSQNISWADGYSQLAPDSKRDLEEVGSLLRERPDAWRGFNGVGIPFQINPDKLAEFHRQFGNFGPIEGEIGSDGLFYFPMPAELIQRLGSFSLDWLVRLKGKIDSLIESLLVFGPGTVVRIITDGTKPLFYNRDDDTLEIHGLFLLEGVTPALLQFCGQHEARHKEITGLSPLLEEVLNIYMDFESLDSMAPQDAIDMVHELENIERDGYAGILRKRFLRTRGLREQDGLLDSVLRYIWDYCPWIIERLNLGDVSKITDPVSVLRRLLDREVDARYSIINLVCEAGRYIEKDFPRVFRLPISQFISHISPYLYTHREIFHRIEEDIHIVSRGLKTKRLSAEYVKALNAFRSNRKKKQLWEEFKKGPVALDIDMRRLIGRIWYELSEYELDNAVYMARAGASQWVIAASLVSKKDLKTVERLARDADVSRDKRQRIIELVTNYRRICSLLEYELHPTNHMIQNVISLIIQLTRGDPDVLMLAMLDKINYLRYLSSDPRDYYDLDERGKALFRQAVECIYIPLAGFLGRDDLAKKMAELYLMIALGGEYQLWEREISESVGLRHEDMPVVLNRVMDIVRDAVSDLAVEVSGRIKSPYSLYYKSREIMDIFGIRFVIKGEHSPEEERRIRMELNTRLQRLFDISMPDMKRLRDKRYNEYDFIAGIKFTSLLEEYGVKGLSLEVQIYPTEDDLQRYRYGPTAHWLYKLETVLKGPIPKQIFDRDVLDRLYKEFRDGDFDSNLRLVYEELTKWKFIGVVSDNKVRILRADSNAIAPDAASAVGIDLFKKEYMGLRRVGTEAVIHNTSADRLVPDIYEVVSGKGLKREELVRIRDITRKPRAYILASRLLGTEPEEKEGRKILEDCLGELKTGINRGYLENNLLNTLLQKAFSLRTLEGFYRLLVLVNKPDGGIMLKELIRRTYIYMTGEDLGERIDIEELKQKWNVKSSQPVSVLVYLFTIAEKGRHYLKAHGFDPERAKNKRRLLALLDDFNAEDLLQLFGKLEINKEIFGKVILLHLRSISPPSISVNLRGADFSDIQDVMDRSGLDIIGFAPSRNKIVYHINPGRYWLDRMDLVLQEIRSIEEVEGAGLIYKEPEVIPMRINLNIPQKYEGQVVAAIGDLFKKLGIDYNLVERSKQRIEYDISIPKKITVKELEDIIHIWLNSIFGKDAKTIKFSIRQKKKSTAPTAGLSIILLGFLPYLVGAKGSLGIVGYAVLGILGILTIIYFAHRLWGERLIKKVDELFNIWRDYDSETVEEAGLLAPFYEEVRDVPSGSEFDEIIQGMQIRRIEKVITKVSDMALYVPKRGIDLRYETQGYKILGLYKGRLYRLLVVGENCQDIGYYPGSAETDFYYSLGNDITGTCRDAIMGKIMAYAAARPNGRIPPVRRLITIPMEGRAEFERFNRESIFSRSIIERFPKTGHKYPSFTHDKYLLIPDDMEIIAHYVPKGKFDRGIFGKSMLSLPGGADALHELVHAIFDYSGELQARVIEHFSENPNAGLEEEITEAYGYDPSNEDDRRGIINEELAYTLSSFAALSRPWYSVGEVGRMRDELNIKTIEDIRDAIFSKIELASKMYGPNDPRLKEIAIRTGRLWNEYYAEDSLETERRVRQEYFETIKELMILINLPPVRLMDVKFFAEAGLIEPWMNPVELGYRLGELKRDVDTEYYLRIIEFLVERSRTSNPDYKLLSTGRWVKTPIGIAALTDARRLAWALIKTDYGIMGLGDLKGSRYEMEKFRTAPSVLGIVERLAKAELGDSVRKRLVEGKDFIRRRESLLGWLRGQIRSTYSETRDKIRYFCKAQTWLMQAFFENAVLEEPRILLLDIKVLQQVNETAKPGLIRLINQVNGRIMVISDDKMDPGYAMGVLNNFWQGNSHLLVDMRLEGVIEKGESRKAYIKLKKRFKPENIVIFTDKDSFVRIWRGLARNSLFYILDKDNLFITSEDLLVIQQIGGVDEFDLQPGVSIKLLPEYYYTGDALRELERREAEQGA